MPDLLADEEPLIVETATGTTPGAITGPITAAIFRSANDIPGVSGNTLTLGTGTVVIGASKTLTVSNTLTLTGTDGTTMTFPSTSANLARTDGSNLFTGAQIISGDLTIGSASDNRSVFQTFESGGSSFVTLSSAVPNKRGHLHIQNNGAPGGSGETIVGIVADGSFGATDYSVAEYLYSGGSNMYLLYVDQQGSGTLRPIGLRYGGGLNRDIWQVPATANRFNFGASVPVVIGAISGSPVSGADLTLATGGLAWSTDNTYDIGKTGANRARDLFLGRNATVGGAVAANTLSLGSSTVSANLDSQRTSAVTSGTIYGAYFRHNLNQPGASSATGYGLVSDLRLQGGANNNTSSVGSWCYYADLTNFTGTGTWTRVGGLRIDLDAKTATLTNAEGVRIQISDTGAGAITNAVGLLITNVAAGTATNKAISTGSGIVALGDTTEATTAGAGAVTAAGGIYAAKSVISGGVVGGKSYTVSALPNAATYPYCFSIVTDATLTAITGLGTVAAGGGGNIVPVYSDGTNWILL